MYAKSFLVIALLSILVASTPMSGSVNVPIPDAQLSALKSGGLKVRGSQVNVPITAAEMRSLEAGGLEARDKVMNCGHLVTGKGGSNGHGKWIPVDEFSQVAETFCSSYVGTDIYKGHQTSDTYSITLTNQKDSKKPGSDGLIVFAIYNTEHAGTWVVEHDTCLRAMKAPLGSHATKRDGKDYVWLGKRDNCYGTKHNDYEGGYYKIDTIGAFGSEVYAA
ncbi:hypothetical protein M434DRAFT_29992 [Hypoxylon sp. CO27-5]|nr:hypothetical protein M434DRAFT_29992 [Hypoxylon sp. CO27-5]